MKSALGYGVYTIPEASLLLGISSRKLSAWFNGWDGGCEAVFHRDYEALTKIGLISFLDLIDLSVASSLRSAGVSLQTIRRINNELARIWTTVHPFSRQELFTDETGRTVFLQAVTDAGEVTFIDILKQQHAMPEILLPFLNKIEYNPATRLAQSLRLTDGVVLDPQRRYGKPIVEASGMPTAVLYRSFLANGRDAEAVADWYGVGPRDVELAVSFETEFAGIAA